MGAICLTAAIMKGLLVLVAVFCTLSLGCGEALQDRIDAMEDRMLDELELEDLQIIEERNPYATCENSGVWCECGCERMLNQNKCNKKKVKKHCKKTCGLC